MARVFRHKGGAIGRSFAPLLTLLSAVVTNTTTKAQLYEQPVLVIDPGKHTAPIVDLSVDAAGRVAVTGSEDKTVRVWSLADGKLLRTIRMPEGQGNVGKVYATAMSPDGALVAASIWVTARQNPIYLFETNTGKMVDRIIGPPNVAMRLAFSADGRYLAAGLAYEGGLRVYDRDRHWSEAFRDADYGNAICGVAFGADGRLATTSFDGKVRLYNRDFSQVVPPRHMTSEGNLDGIAFRPDGTTLAVGHENARVVDLLDGHSLKPMPRPNIDGLYAESLANVAWSKDGNTLYAGGGVFVLAWANAGRGKRRTLPGGQDSIFGLAALADGRLLVAAADPFLELLEADGVRQWTIPSPKADLRDQGDALAISTDGAIVDFGFYQYGKSPVRFDLHTLKLVPDPTHDHQTFSAKRSGLHVEGWPNGPHPTLEGKPIELMPNELSRSLAIDPEGERFVLGTDYTLQAIDARGKPLWTHRGLGAVWAVNVTGDGRLVVAAYNDGTIRWHRMDDGRELLALYVLPDRQNWVAWTPEGFYDATRGAFSMLQWHLNRGFDAAADTVPVNAIPTLKRPDALRLVLREMETARALGIADLKAARLDVQTATGAAKAPGAKLHVLTIGVSDYGDKARNLALKFADRDAKDIANALVNTQEGGLYAEVKLISLQDSKADKASIFQAFDDTAHNMEGSAGQDLAVVMFSGHGTMINDQFYLVPYGADSSTPAHLEASAIPTTQFQNQILKLARHGRVLVLLDACRSAGLIGGAPAAEMLKSVLAQGNVTVLTSSTTDKVSRESEEWQHGAFTKVLLDALSGSAADTDHNGAISMEELTAYVATHLLQLTGGDQHLGREIRFGGDIFVAGL